MAAPVKSPEQKRKDIIKLIHVGKRELCLDDETYRDLLQTTVGKKSTTDLTLAQLERVLSALKDRGFKIKPNRKPSMPLAQDAMSRKIRALWLELHTLGYVDNPSEAALAQYVKRITHIEALQWLSSAQQSTVIESLKKWLLRDNEAIQDQLDSLVEVQKIKKQTIDQLFMLVTGSHEQNKRNANSVKEYLGVLANE